MVPEHLTNQDDDRGLPFLIRSSTHAVTIPRRRGAGLRKGEELRLGRIGRFLGVAVQARLADDVIAIRADDCEETDREDVIGVVRR
jgi:hypothetical protein